MGGRPEDYGDQYPADNGDVVPTDKTSTFQEVDYRLNDQGAARPLSNLLRAAELVPPEGPEVQGQKRTTYTGVVTKIEKGVRGERDNNVTYWILRQDLRRGKAYIIGNETPEYNDLRIGDEVSLTAGEVQGQWRIIGPVRQKLVPTLTIACTCDVTDGDKLFIFNDKLQTTDFGEPVFNLHPVDEPTEIRVSCPAEMQIELLFKANVTLVEPKQLTKITVISDIRLNEDETDLEVYQGVIEGLWLTPPKWVNKIPLHDCSTYGAY